MTIQSGIGPMAVRIIKSSIDKPNFQRVLQWVSVSSVMSMVEESCLG
jgi:hypothetical protein